MTLGHLEPPMTDKCSAKASKGRKKLRGCEALFLPFPNACFLMALFPFPLLTPQPSPPKVPLSTEVLAELAGIAGEAGAATH